MALRRIVLLGDPVLRRPAEEVTEFDEELQELVTDLYETMYEAEGIGLAAPQVGVSRRVCVVDVREEGAQGHLAIVNPHIVEASRKRSRKTEGCLSIPGVEEAVERPAEVTVEGRDVRGEPLALSARGIFARALQHEIDHLDGVLFLDRLSPLKRRMLLAKWRKSGEGRE